MTRPGDLLSSAYAQPLTAEAQASLARYATLLYDANRTLNLTAVRDPAAIAERHLAESLAVARLLEERLSLPLDGSVIDVGSGGGLPGVPLAIVWPERRVVLLEATRKKVEFLRGVIERLPLPNVRALEGRAEALAHDPDQREAYDLAIARAVAPLAALVELMLPFVRVGGWCAAIKGSRAQSEVEQATAAIEQCGGRLRGVLALDQGRFPEMHVVLIEKAAATPARLPRRAGMPAKRPLGS